MADRPDSDWELNLKPVKLQHGAAAGADDASHRGSSGDDEAMSIAIMESLRSLRRSLERVEERLTTIEHALAIVTPAETARSRIPPIRRQRTVEGLRKGATLPPSTNLPGDEPEAPTAEN